MSKVTYEMVKRFIDQDMKTITLKWSEVDTAWKVLIHDRILNSGYSLFRDDGTYRVYKLQINEEILK